MPPNAESSGLHSGANPGFRVDYPSMRDEPERNADSWIQGKRKDDGVGKLWRLHDKLYDLTEFMDRHPGGRFWLEQTRGTDITEAFEASHLNPAVYKLLPKFYVKDASGPRNSPYTFRENGFYMTLKKKVWPIVSRVGSGPSLPMKLMQDTTVAVFLALMITAAQYHSYVIAVAAGVVMAMVTAMSHNFFHQADNFRMYYFDLSPLSSHDWRITHGLSHHLFPNTLYDYEISFLEPFMYFLPSPNKSWAAKYISPITCHMLMLSLFLVELVKQAVCLAFGKRQFQWPLLLPVAEACVMVAAAGDFVIGLCLFLTMVCAGSMSFLYVGLTAAHHHPDIYHTPDVFRKEPDWGLCQMDAVRDRADVDGNFFLGSIVFGDHTLHHLFPTVDYSKLKHLYPVFAEHCRDYDINFGLVTQAELCKGMYKQLSRSTRNTSPPGYKKGGNVLLPKGMTKEGGAQEKGRKTK